MNLSGNENTFVTVCPGCGKKYRLSQKYLGRTVRCKHCKQTWQANVSQENKSGDATEVLSSDELSAQAVETSTPKPATSGSFGDTSGLVGDQTWIGKRLGRFQILDLLGKGAMGIVFRAHDPDLKRDVALKILEKQFIDSQKKTYRLEQFIREARSAARLTHPNSVTVYEIGKDKGWYFIAMELVEGGTLLDLVRKKKKKIPIEVVCELIAQAADALSAAHKLGIIHRDIKPSNLMLTKDGRVKVTDFGLAQLQDTADDFELPTKAVGTPYWMSHEQCKGEDALPQSDIYSLGAVLYFALTGEVPFKGKTKREILNQHLYTPVPNPRSARKDIPDSVYNIIKKAMEKNPASRYQDAAEMGIALRNIASAIRQRKLEERFWPGLGGSTTSIPTSIQKTTSIGKIIGIIVLLIILIVGGYKLYTYYQISQPKPTPIKTPVIQGPPVYVIKGTRRYHAKGCPTLKNIPPDKLIELPSPEEAERQGYIPDRYCKDLLEKQKREFKLKQRAKTQQKK